MPSMQTIINPTYNNTLSSMPILHHPQPQQPTGSASPCQSLEDIHFNIAQEITRAMSHPNYPNHNNTHPNIPVSSSLQHSPSRSSSETTIVEVVPRKHVTTTSMQVPDDINVRTVRTRCARTQARAPIHKPAPAEEELVRKIHRKVGGPAKLSTYDDPARVRHVVIEALALEQTDPAEIARIRRGQLTVFERRVVRTVTNRGAAVRSRMRQRKEVAHLKGQLLERDSRISQLENMVRGLCSKFSVPIPDTLSPVQTFALSQPLPTTSSAQINTNPTMLNNKFIPSVGLKQEAELSAFQQQDVSRMNIIPPVEQQPTQGTSEFPVNQEVFTNFMDHMIGNQTWNYQR